MSRITINEAITWLMADKRLRPEEQVAEFAMATQEFERQRVSCLEILPLTGLPGSGSMPINYLEFSMLKPEELLKRLEWQLPYLPLPIKRLVKDLDKYVKTRSSFLIRHAETLQYLLQEARVHNIRIFGRRHPKTKFVVLTAEDLRHRYILPTPFMHLLVGEDTDAAPAGSIQDAATVLFDAQVDEAEILSLMIDDLWAPGPRSRAPEPHLTVIVEWIHHVDQGWFRSLTGTPKGYRKQEIELVRAFPGVVDPNVTLKAADKAMPFRLRRGRPPGPKELTAKRSKIRQ
jgi:hypothetical protein